MSRGELFAPEQPGELDRLRTRLDEAPDDEHTRLRLCALLDARGERTSARRLLEPLEAWPAGKVGTVARTLDVRRLARRWLARFDAEEGRAEIARRRWERLLADDVDDIEALSHLGRRLDVARPAELVDGAGGEGGGHQGGDIDRFVPTTSPIARPTLVTPAGARASRFEIVEELGRGATSTVYLARDPRLGIYVALKVLHPGRVGAASALARTRFFAEARLAASLRHPGVVAIYELDEHAHSIALEYIPGGTLRDRLRRGRPSVGEVVATARSLLLTMAFLHDHGLVHGDLTPRNLLLRAPGQPVVADFGAARLADQGVPGPGDLGAGTPLYLAPEQLRGAPSSVAGDLFAAGAILWEMLAGRPLRTHADLMAGRTATPPPPAPAGGSDEDLRPLARLIERLCASDPLQRPESAAAALAALGSEAERDAQP